MAKLTPVAVQATGFWEYRINGGQYTRSSAASMSPRDAFHAVVQTPDVEIAEGDTFANGDYLWDGTKFRKGTAQEIAAFATAEAADNVSGEKTRAKDLLVTRRELAAIVELTMDEINILRQREGLAARTKQQFITAFNAKVDAST